MPGESFPRISCASERALPGLGELSHGARAGFPARQGTSLCQEGAGGAVLLYHQRWGNIGLFLEAMAKADVGGELAFRSLRQAGIILRDEK